MYVRNKHLLKYNDYVYVWLTFTKDIVNNITFHGLTSFVRDIWWRYVYREQLESSVDVSYEVEGEVPKLTPPTVKVYCSPSIVWNRVGIINRFYDRWRNVILSVQGESG